MSLIVICRRQHTSHMRITPTARAIRLEYGNFKDGRFEPLHREDLSYEENPELRYVHDGVGWNVFDLADLVQECRVGELCAGIQITLQSREMALLEEAGLTLA